VSTALRQASGKRAAGGGKALAPASVGFPAGWDTGRPWFLAGPARAGAALPVKPPPPPFPAQPVQGSRLGPLPPVGLFAQRQSRPLTSAATNAAAAAAAPPDPAEICPPKPCAAAVAAARADAAAAAASEDAACAKVAPAKVLKPSAGPGSGPSSASTAVDSESTAAAAACEPGGGGGGGSRAASGSAAATDSVCLDRSGYAGSGSGGASGNSKAPACPDAGAASARAPAAQPPVADAGAPSEAGVQPGGACAACEGAAASVAAPDALPGATPRAERVRRRLGDDAYQQLRGEVLAQHAQHREQARRNRERGSSQPVAQLAHPCAPPLYAHACRRSSMAASCVAPAHDLVVFCCVLVSSLSQCDVSSGARGSRIDQFAGCPCGS